MACLAILVTNICGMNLLDIIGWFLPKNLMPTQRLCIGIKLTFLDPIGLSLETQEQVFDSLKILS